jgi:Cdc6-like AAA superfamily ATPase
MSFELPHRKVLILGAICASIILVSLSYKLASNKSAVKESSLVAVAGETESNQLADKRILETLEQIKLEELKDIASSTNPFAPDPKDTVSDRFAKDVFAAYLKYQQNEGKISDDDLSRDAIANIKTDFIPKPRFNLSSIKIFAPKNNDEIKAYGNQFAKEYLETVGKTQTNPEKYSKRVSDLRPIYEEIVANMKKMQVPSQIASEHIELMNSLGIMSDSLALIDAQSDDPVKALLGLRMIQESVPKQYNMFIRISDFFQQNGILFSNSEYGSIWNQQKGLDESLLIRQNATTTATSTK